MNKNTYEAIKTIVITVKLDNKNREILRVTIKQVEDWIDEVAKEDKWDTCGRWIEEKNPE